VAGTPIAPNTPSSQGGAVVSYSISPSVPAGLTFNLTTGVITGTPTDTSPTKKYTVTATNTGGSAFDTLSIAVYAKSTNPITITGRYLSSTKVEITLANYGTLRNAAPSPWVGSVQVWWKKNSFPTDTTTLTTLGKNYGLSTLKAAGSQYVDTITLSLNTFAQTDSVAIASDLVWNDNTWSGFSRASGTMVSMRDPSRPANNLVISGTYILGGNTAEIYLDSLSTIDPAKTASVDIWYNFADTGYFGDYTKNIPIATLLQAAVNGRYVDPETNTMFGGETKIVYCEVRLIGTNGLISAFKGASFSVGQPRPQNPITLTAHATSTSDIFLSWNQLGTGIDSIRIWFGKTQVPLVANPSDVVFNKFTIVLPADSTYTVSNLDYGTWYYFGAQVFSNGIGSLVTQQSSASCRTDTITELIKIKNTAKIANMTLDSITHTIWVEWTVDTSVAGGDTLMLGLGYSLSGWPLDTLVNSPSNTVKILNTSGRDSLKLNGKLLFDTTYYAGLWLRRSKGAWSPPVDIGAMDTLRAPSFTWQDVKYGVGQVDFAFNRKVKLISDSTVDLTTDRLNYVRFQTTDLNGFIPVSIGFSFRDKNQGAKFFIGVHYDSIPAGHTLSDVRMYRWNAATNSFMLDTNVVYYDTVNHYISVKTKQLDYPFIAMIDTMSPQAQALPPGTDLDAPVAGGQDITLSFIISDNISNVKCKLEYTKGGSSFDDGGSTPNTWLSSQIETIGVTILGDFVSQDYGLRAHLILSDGVHIDTIDLSRQVIRATSSDPVATEPMKWCPLRVTAFLDKPAATSALKDLAVKGVWKYDPVQFRLFRWYATAGNAGNDSNKYVEYSDATDTLFSFYPGRLIWIKTRDSKPIDFGSAITPSLKRPDTIELQPKTWSDIALPYKFDIKVGDIVRTTVDSGQRGDTLRYCSWQKKDTTINGVKRQYYSKYIFVSDFSGLGTPIADSNASFSEGIGAVYNPLSVPVKLFIPPIPTALSKIALSKKKETSKGWSVGISGRTLSGTSLNTVFCGYINGKGTATYYPLPPSFDNITMSVSDGQKRQHANVITHGNWNKDGGVCFDLAFTNAGGSTEEIELGVVSYGNVPGGNLRIALFDPATGILNDAGKDMHVVVGSNACEYRKLIIGSEAYLAKVKLGGEIYKLALIGAYPNPFRHSLRIRYSIPEKNIRAVDFSIVNLSGREVWRTTLTSGALAAGLGAVAWNGRGRDNCPVASGLYIVRMVATGVNGKRSGVFEKRITYMP
jgi:Putative Ig domain.